MKAPYYVPASDNAPIIGSGAAAAEFWRQQVMTASQFRPELEWVVTLLLDPDQRLLGHLAPVSDGAGAWVRIALRSVLREVLVNEASSIVILHQHTEGALAPSDADLQCAHTLTRWMEGLELSLADLVIVDRLGEHFYSFREAGQFEARAAVVHDARAGTYERALETALELMAIGDRRLPPCVSESANRAGVSQGQWLADFLFKSLVENFTPEPLEDRRLALFGALHRRAPWAVLRAQDDARLVGKGLTQFIFETGVELLAERFGGKGAGGKGY